MTREPESAPLPHPEGEKGEITVLRGGEVLPPEGKDALATGKDAPLAKEESALSPLAPTEISPAHRPEEESALALPSPAPEDVPPPETEKSETAALSPEEAAEEGEKEEGKEKEAEKAASPRREGMLERALTALVMILLAGGVSWGFARPRTLVEAPKEGGAVQERRAPECRRIRFDLAKMLGERWKPLAVSCVRGDCKSLRDELIARNFSIAEWSLLDPEGEDDGCQITAGGARSNDPACSRLIGRIEGGAETLLLQVAGECRESP